MRFTRNRHKNDCCPVAVANILKWLGFAVSYNKTKKELMTWMEYDPELGTPVKGLIPKIKQFFKDVAKVKKIKSDITNVDQTLDNGKILMIFLVNGDGYHTSLIVSKQDNRYLYVNRTLDKTASWLPKELVIRDLVNSHLYSIEKKVKIVV